MICVGDNGSFRPLKVDVGLLGLFYLFFFVLDKDTHFLVSSLVGQVCECVCVCGVVVRGGGSG